MDIVGNSASTKDYVHSKINFFEWAEINVKEKKGKWLRSSLLFSLFFSFFPFGKSTVSIYDREESCMRDMNHKVRPKSSDRPMLEEVLTTNPRVGLKRVKNNSWRVKNSKWIVGRQEKEATLINYWIHTLKMPFVFPIILHLRTVK